MKIGDIYRTHSNMVIAGCNVPVGSRIEIIDTHHDLCTIKFLYITRNVTRNVYINKFEERADEINKRRKKLISIFV